MQELAEILWHYWKIFRNFMYTYSNVQRKQWMEKLSVWNKKKESGGVNIILPLYIHTYINFFFFYRIVSEPLSMWNGFVCIYTYTYIYISIFSCYSFLSNACFFSKIWRNVPPQDTIGCHHTHTRTVVRACVRACVYECDWGKWCRCDFWAN